MRGLREPKRGQPAPACVGGWCRNRCGSDGRFALHCRPVLRGRDFLGSRFRGSRSGSRRSRFGGWLGSLGGPPFLAVRRSNHQARASQEVRPNKPARTPKACGFRWVVDFDMVPPDSFHPTVSSRVEERSVATIRAVLFSINPTLRQVRDDCQTVSRKNGTTDLTTADSSVFNVPEPAAPHRRDVRASHRVEGAGDPHTPTHAQCRRGAAAIASRDAPSQMHRQPCSARADRMTQGDRSTLVIDALGIETRLGHTRQRLSRKRFIDLDPFPISDTPSAALRQRRQGVDRPNPIHCGSHPTTADSTHRHRTGQPSRRA